MSRGPLHQVHVKQIGDEVSVSVYRHARMNEAMADSINEALSPYRVQLMRNPGGSGWVLSAGGVTSAVDPNTAASAHLSLTTGGR